VYSGGQTKTVRLKPVRAGDLPRDRSGVMIIGDGGFGFGDFFPPLPAVAPVAPRPPRIFEFDGDLLRDGIRMRLDPRAEVEIHERATEAARRAREATRDLMERLERLKYDIDRRADDAEAIVAPAPSRPRAGSRIASAEGVGASAGSGDGHASAAHGSGGGFVSYAPARRVSNDEDGIVAMPASRETGSRVAHWKGDDATFTLQGLRLARVNDDLADYLGNGSERGFLVVDAGNGWSGIRSGDVLLAVDGKPVRSGAGARIALDAGDDHTAEVIRDGRRRMVDVDVR
jgi:hypothetical protein